ncbi:MAG TPA: methylated-DNA--[protein]-cysteine S-methyltransferase, partial [Candidatus Lustribacter sp.]|nr:methylated-DNA--[protein]-cysteine S-methyltransferase [Candidatus Lustribacter sp.]
MAEKFRNLLYADRIDSPIGTLLIISDGAQLCALDYRGYDHRMNAFLAARYGEYRLTDADDPGGASSAVRAYLAGDIRALDAVAVDAGGTPFQARVWAELRRIPAGTTITYGELARRLGQPSASRAVGHANSLNPVAIVVPCHRVIGADATLTGYAGGLDRKRWLLQHEGVQLRESQPPRSDG